MPASLHSLRRSILLVALILAALAVGAQPGWGQISVSLPSVAGTPGHVLLVPVTVGNLAGGGAEVFSYNFTLGYDAAVVAVTGIEVAGTRSEGTLTAVNTTVAGQLSVGVASATPLTGAGTLLVLRVQLLAAGSTGLTFEGFTFNSGTPSAATTSGTVAVTALNQAPWAGDDAATTLEDTALLLDVLANDSDSDGTLDAASLTLGNVTAGSAFASAATGIVTFIPAVDFAGMASFTYTVKDDDGSTSNVATVTIQVDPVNDPPRFALQGDLALRTGAGAQTIPGFATMISPGAENEADQRVSFEVASDHGALFSQAPQIDADGTLRFTPAPGAVGQTTVTVWARDDGGTAGGGRDTSEGQTFTITVRAPNQAPSAANDAATTLEDTPVVIGVLANDADADGALDAASLAVTGDPAHGTLAVVTGGALRYTPQANFNGQDSFRYTVRDNEGAVSNEATVVVTVTPVNDAPSAPQVSSPADGAELVITGDPAAQLTVAWTAATDPDGDALTYTWQLAAAAGFSHVLAEQAAGASTQIATTFGALAALLDAAGVALGKEITLYHRVVTSDGRLETVGPAARVRLVRGAITEADAGEMPTEFALEAAYPNPFNPTTTVAFALPAAAEVRLAVYDALGREVALLAEGPRAAGRHRVVFEAAGLPSGLYLVRLQASAFSGVRRVLLVK